MRLIAVFILSNIIRALICLFNQLSTELPNISNRGLYDIVGDFKVPIYQILTSLVLDEEQTYNIFFQYLNNFFYTHVFLLSIICCNNICKFYFPTTL